MNRLVPILLAAGAAFAVAAPGHTQSEDGARRVSQLIVYGDDPCPASTEEEIVVCARRPEDDRYRIPEPLRGTGQRRDRSWAANARSLETVGRTGIQSCSTVGPGGFTGCWAEMMRQAREDRRANPEGQPVP
ncbi:MAG TPA: hypothetical protein VF702_13540 [Allosphingosinicella sp.]|jgi:hypothetical protein